LIASARDIRGEWLEDCDSIGVTAGASTPEILVQQVVENLRQRGFARIEEVELIEENVHFPLPAPLDKIQPVGSLNLECHKISNSRHNLCSMNRSIGRFRFLFLCSTNRAIGWANWKRTRRLYPITSFIFAFSDNSITRGFVNWRSTFAAGSCPMAGGTFIPGVHPK